MRKTYYILFFLVFQITFSQVEKNNIQFLKVNLLESSNEKTQSLVNKKALDLFPKIIKLNIKNTKKNSEGKFALNTENKKYFILDKLPSENLVSTKKNTTKKTKLTDNLAQNTKKEFINTLVKKKIAEEIQKFILLNEALTYGDRNLESYRNLTDLDNKLIFSMPVLKNIEVQVGKDVYPYLKKILKTELDKTMQNSINLFAINF